MITKFKIPHVTTIANCTQIPNDAPTPHDTKIRNYTKISNDTPNI